MNMEIATWLLVFYSGWCIVVITGSLLAFSMILWRGRKDDEK